MISPARVSAAALVLCLVGAASAAAQPGSVKSKEGLTPAAVSNALAAAKAVMSCKPMILGQAIAQPDGGMMSTPQGWFHKAEVFANRDGKTTVLCHYGIDKGMPANRPTNDVQYGLTGFKAEQCTVDGPNILCKAP